MFCHSLPVSLLLLLPLISCALAPFFQRRILLLFFLSLPPSFSNSGFLSGSAALLLLRTPSFYVDSCAEIDSQQLLFPVSACAWVLRSAKGGEGGREREMGSKSKGRDIQLENGSQKFPVPVKIPSSPLQPPPPPPPHLHLCSRFPALQLRLLLVKNEKINGSSGSM